jgi:pyridoxal phosphate enzyme (YggS family)
MPDLIHNLEAVQQRIALAAQVAGRDARSITLLAVSKTFPAEDVRAAYAAGQRAFGENYVQEAITKIEALADLRASLEWHFIGPLQSNKTRPVAESFDWVHSVDRLKIAQRLSEQRPDNLPPLNVCLQVNISGEASKSGVSIAEAVEVAQAIAALPKLNLRGLMAIPEPAGSIEDQRVNCSSVCAMTASNSIRSRWACRATSKPPCWKARRSCASARRSSAREITLTDRFGPFLSGRLT